MADNLMLIDVSGWIYRFFFALPPMVRSDGTPVNAVHGCVGALWKIMQSNPSHICAVFDAAKHTFRNDIYPDYKAHRPAANPDLSAQVPLIRRAIEVFGVPTTSAKTFEADDLIATYVRMARESGLDVTIISSDKDLTQLITPHHATGPAVRMLDPLQNKMIGPDEVFAKFGVWPQDMGDLLALMGDASDNIPGVPGVGSKTAAKLINAYGAIEAVLAAAQELDPAISKKIQSNLNLFADDARISRLLTALRDDAPVELDFEAMRCRTPDSAAVSAFLDDMEFVTLREDIFGRDAA